MKEIRRCCELVVNWWVVRARRYGYLVASTVQAILHHVAEPGVFLDRRMSCGWTALRWVMYSYSCGRGRGY